MVSPNLPATAAQKPSSISFTVGHILFFLCYNSHLLTGTFVHDNVFPESVWTRWWIQSTESKKDKDSLQYVRVLLCEINQQPLSKSELHIHAGHCIMNINDDLLRADFFHIMFPQVGSRWATLVEKLLKYETRELYFQKVICMCIIEMTINHTCRVTITTTVPHHMQ